MVGTQTVECHMLGELYVLTMHIISSDLPLRDAKTKAYSAVSTEHCQAIETTC